MKAREGRSREEKRIQENKIKRRSKRRKEMWMTSMIPTLMTIQTMNPTSFGTKTWKPVGASAISKHLSTTMSSATARLVIIRSSETLSGSSSNVTLAKVSTEYTSQTADARSAVSFTPCAHYLSTLPITA